MDTASSSADAPYSSSPLKDGHSEGSPQPLASRLRAAIGKGDCVPATLVLEDGTLFHCWAHGAKGEVVGEICFNTSMEGYLEILSDPSYAGQIVVMAYPQIGNYGINIDDLQSENPSLRALVVHDLCLSPSNWRSTGSLSDYLDDKGIMLVEGVDSRAIIRHIRETGAQNAIISTMDGDADSLISKIASSPSFVGTNLVEGVSCSQPYAFHPVMGSRAFAIREAADALSNVVAYDCGVKRSILAGLANAGCNVTVVPWDTPAEEVLAMAPDGVFLSNGPGDPQAVSSTSEQAAKLLGKVPVFGICLGHQMISLACGGRIEKLKYGHRGGNHPVMNLISRRVEITAQNHGFSLVFPSLGALMPELSGGICEHASDLRFWVERGIAPVVSNERFGRIRLTHVNLNDGTCEGIAFLDLPAFSVQYHPEANPGPTDSQYLFESFVRLMQGRPDFLEIDISGNRTAGWSFGSNAHAETSLEGACHA